jgi:hypothetical protein
MYTASFALKNQTFTRLSTKPRLIHHGNINGFIQHSEVWTFGVMRDAGRRQL